MELKTSLKNIALCGPLEVVSAIKKIWEEFPTYDKQRENTFILYLNVKNELLCVELHCQGTIDHSIVYPREVIRKALLSNAGAIILIHNHPSGTNAPSKEDRRLTTKIKDACRIMDINVLDHIIISDNEDYFSFQEKGEL